jgi:hypothetical protein
VLHDVDGHVRQLHLPGQSAQEKLPQCAGWGSRPRRQSGCMGNRQANEQLRHLLWQLWQLILLCCERWPFLGPCWRPVIWQPGKRSALANESIVASGRYMKISQVRLLVSGDTDIKQLRQLEDALVAHVLSPSSELGSLKGADCHPHPRSNAKLSKDSMAPSWPACSAHYWEVKPQAQASSGHCHHPETRWRQLLQGLLYLASPQISRVQFSKGDAQCLPPGEQTLEGPKVPLGVPQVALRTGIPPMRFALRDPRHHCAITQKMPLPNVM